MLLLNVTLAVGPALLLLRWAYRRDTAQPEPRRLVLGAFGLGIVAVALAIVVGLALEPLAELFTGASRIAYRAYFIAGFLEEAAKLAVVLFFVARHKEFDEVADGMVYTMAAGLGFAVVENALYLVGPPTVLLIRGISAVPLHAAAGGVMGFFVGMSRIEGRGSVLTGLLAAVALHGSYDYFLFTGGALSFATIPLLIVALILVGILFRVSVKRDQDAGRVPRHRSGTTRPPDRSET
ncbi:MAG: PrsW family intramembrane metalloprotease [Spirochaetia bacterium]